MKVYSDIDMELDILSAMKYPVFGSCSPLGGRLRTRRFGWDVTLRSAVSRRHTNTGTHGAGGEGAATWDDYGRFIAALYLVDPSARIGPYTSAEDFHTGTSNAYRLERAS